MPKCELEHLPDEARLWIYGFCEPLDSTARGLIEGRLNAFMQDWNTHGSPVSGAWGFLEDRFVLVAGVAGRIAVPGWWVRLVSRRGFRGWGGSREQRGGELRASGRATRKHGCVAGVEL